MLLPAAPAQVETPCGTVPRSTNQGYVVDAELAKGFDDLVRCVDTGYVPAGDPVLDPTAVATPTFGCRFTHGAHPNFTAERACQTFPDVADSVHHHPIESLAAAGVLTGRSGGGYDPVAPITRGQVASVIAGALELPSNADDPQFSETAGTTHESAIRAVAKAGIVKGYADASFRPEQPVARDQLAAFVARALGVAGGTQIGCFDDVRGTTHEAAVCALSDLGIVSGIAEKRFGPFQQISRGQTASIVWRAAL